MTKSKSSKRRTPAGKKASRRPAGKTGATAPVAEPEEEPTDEESAGAQVPEDDDNVDMKSLEKIFNDASKAEDSGWGLRTADVECPHCGEEFEISVDPSEEGQEMIQDCQACCRPVTFAVEIFDGEVLVSAYRDD